MSETTEHPVRTAPAEIPTAAAELIISILPVPSTDIPAHELASPEQTLPASDSPSRVTSWARRPTGLAGLCQA